MNSKEKKAVSFDVIPEDKGEIEYRITATCANEKINIRRTLHVVRNPPEIHFTVESDEGLKVEEWCTLHIKLGNKGKGIATGIAISIDGPGIQTDGEMIHSKLGSNEVRTLSMSIYPKDPGKVPITTRVKYQDVDGNEFNPVEGHITVKVAGKNDAKSKESYTFADTMGELAKLKTEGPLIDFSTHIDKSTKTGDIGLAKGPIGGSEQIHDREKDLKDYRFLLKMAWADGILEDREIKQLEEARERYI